MVASVILLENTADFELGNCVARAIRSWQFPAGGSVTHSVLVSYPFNFELGERRAERELRAADA